MLKTTHFFSSDPKHWITLLTGVSYCPVRTTEKYRSAQMSHLCRMNTSLFIHVLFFTAMKQKQKWKEAVCVLVKIKSRKNNEKGKNRVCNLLIFQANPIFQAKSMKPLFCSTKVFHCCSSELLPASLVDHFSFCFLVYQCPKV